MSLLPLSVTLDVCRTGVSGRMFGMDLTRSRTWLLDPPIGLVQSRIGRLHSRAPFRGMKGSSCRKGTMMNFGFLSSHLDCLL
ncbi:hypothetical protein AAHA92_31123 [Salvia divinorum]|uniref:Uncharacterized protein n=1 Tax=Salvia divinorum TaxID=28513 RepID=A0ABD1FT50_SALDI